MNIHPPCKTWIADWVALYRRTRPRNSALTDPRESSRHFGGPGRLPGWLVSVLLHLVLLATLAAGTFSAVEPNRPEILLHTTTPPDLEELAELTFAAPPVDLPVTEPVVLAPLANPTVDMGVGVEPTTPAVVPAPAVPGTSVSSEIHRLLDRKWLGQSVSGPQPGQAEFFGVRAAGRRFVFLVDSSRSMRGTRFSGACQELVQAIRRLNREQFFYVILFDQHPKRMILPPESVPPPRPVPATPQNASRFELWLAGVQLEAGADPRQSLQWALAMWPDAVFLLSDGEFGAETESWFEQVNYRDDPEHGRVPRVVLHTIGFQSRKGQDRLRRMAERHGGTYRFVPAPPAR